MRKSTAIVIAILLVAFGGMLVAANSALAPLARDAGVAGQGELIIAKQRNGPTGIVKLAWLEKHTRFENLSQQPYDEFENFEPDQLD